MLPLDDNGHLRIESKARKAFRLCQSGNQVAYRVDMAYGHTIMRIASSCIYSLHYETMIP